METSSRRTRSKSSFGKQKSVDKLPGPQKSQLSGRTSTVEKNKSSNKGKTTLLLSAPFIEKKLGYSQADISCSAKSSPARESGSRDSISAEADSSIKKNRGSTSCKTSSLKEVHSPVDTVSAGANEEISKGKDNMNRDEMQKRKHILSLVRSSQISKKERHKRKGVDRKKRSQSHKRRHAAVVSNHTSKEASLLPDTSKSCSKHISFDQQNSSSVTKKDTRVLKLSIKKQPEVISFA